MLRCLKDAARDEALVLQSSLTKRPCRSIRCTQQYQGCQVVEQAGAAIQYFHNCPMLRKNPVPVNPMQKLLSNARTAQHSTEHSTAPTFDLVVMQLCGILRHTAPDHDYTMVGSVTPVVPTYSDLVELTSTHCANLPAMQACQGLREAHLPYVSTRRRCSWLQHTPYGHPCRYFSTRVPVQSPLESVGACPNACQCWRGQVQGLLCPTTMA
jgi:hypothetical protein